MKIETFFHPSTYTLTYLVYDENSKDAVLIDSVADYDPKSSILGFKSGELIKEKILSLGLNLCYLLETHAHADHLTGISYFKKYFPQAKTAISYRIKEVQGVFSDLFDNKENTTGKDFDILLEDAQEIKLQGLNIKTFSTPGHTPACMTFVINDKAAFTGDLLFAPDYGTGRCDFPAGSSKDMFHSIQNVIYKQLRDDTRIYPGHDYMPGGRIVWESASVKTHKNENIQIRPDTQEESFVNFRDQRDKGLAAPHLLLQSVQFNAWAGKSINESTPFFRIPLRVIKA